MIRTSKITLSGNTYLLVMTNRVLSRLEEMGISLEKLGENMPITNTMKLLQLMIDAGARYAAREHLGEYPTITLEDLMDITGPEDYEPIQAAIAGCINAGRTVDAVPAKNAAATPAAQAPSA